MRLPLPQFVVGLSLCLIVGCQGTDPTAPAVAHVTSLSPANAVVVCGSSIEFTALFDRERTPTQELLWSVDCSGDGCGTIQPSGPTTATYTAPSTVPLSREAFIKAALPGEEVSARVLIAQMELTIQVSPTSATVSAGGSTEFVATVEGDPANAGVRWVPVSTNGVRIGTISPNPSASGQPATFTPRSGLPPGTHFALLAISVADPVWSDSASITIGP